MFAQALELSLTLGLMLASSGGMKLTFKSKYP